MDRVGKQEIRALLDHDQGLSVSIYMKTGEPSPQGWEKARIRLKNLLNDSLEALQEHMRKAQAEALLAPARELIGSGRFHAGPGNGLALFLQQDFFRIFRTAVPHPELVHVANRFYIKPLLPLLAQNGRFYLLALSQNNTQLYEGTAYNMEPVPVEDLPANLAEALKYEDPERQLQFHTSTAQVDGGRAAVFHGHGVADEEKRMIRDYFRQINRALHDFLREETAPLALAGVDYLLPIYEEVNTYPHLLPQGITGSPEGRPQHELHQMAWQTVRPHYEAAQAEAKAQYEQLAGTERASSTLADIVRAAHYGRVATLFVDIDETRWGNFNPSEDRVEVHPQRTAVSIDLLDLIAAETIRHDGDVFALTAGDESGMATVTAVFRY